MSELSGESAVPPPATTSASAEPASPGAGADAGGVHVGIPFGLSLTLPKVAARLVRLIPRVAFLEIVLGLIALYIPMRLFWVLGNRMMHTPLGYDEQFFAWGGWCITRGLAPYVDFFEWKPPLVFITHAFAIKLCGDKGTDFRWFFTILPMTSITLLHISLLTRRVHKAISVALVCALVFAWVNPSYHDNALADAESIGLSYYFAGIAALLAQTGRYKKYFEVLGGALLACTVLSKEPFTLGVIGSWVTCYFLNYGTKDFRVSALRYLKFTTAGVLALAAGLFVYMAPTGALRGYLALVRSYRALFRNPALSYCVLLGRWKPGTLLEELHEQKEYIYAQYFNPANLGYLTPFFVAAFAFAYKRSKVLLASSFVTFLLALYAVTATNCQWPHYYNMALTGMFLLFIVGVDSMGPVLAASGSTMRRFVCATFVVTIAVYMWPRYDSERDLGHLDFPPLTEPVPGVFDFVAQNSAPTDKIWTTGPPLLYMHTHRFSATRESTFLDEFLTYNEGDNDVERVSGLRAQLERNRPKIVIVDPEAGGRKSRHMAALVRPFLEAHHYRSSGPFLWLRPD
jgi:hypothetical protein